MLLEIFTLLAASLGDTPTGYDESMAKFLVDYAAIGYCIDDYNDTVAHWTCPVCKKHPEVKKVVTFHTKAHHKIPFIGTQDDTTGYMAYANDTKGNQFIVLAVTGTDPLHVASLIKDFDFLPTFWDRDDCKGLCIVDRGFYMGYYYAKEQLKEMFAQFEEELGNADVKIYVTGHSLGAVMAVQAAMDLQDMGYDIDELYTFGEPRLGNKNVGAYIKKRFKKHYRLTHKLDPVPQLPPQFYFDFHHPDREVFYEGNDTGSFHECDGSGEDPLGQNKMNISFGIREFFQLDDHLHYAGMNFMDNYAICKIA